MYNELVDFLLTKPKFVHKIRIRRQIPYILIYYV